MKILRSIYYNDEFQGTYQLEKHKNVFVWCYCGFNKKEKRLNLDMSRNTEEMADREFYQLKLNVNLIFKEEDLWK